MQTCAFFENKKRKRDSWSSQISLKYPLTDADIQTVCKKFKTT